MTIYNLCVFDITIHSYIRALASLIVLVKITFILSIRAGISNTSLIIILDNQIVIITYNTCTCKYMCTYNKGQ